MEKVMNEENEWDHTSRISAGVKGGPVDYIRIDEVCCSIEKDEKM